MVETVGRRWPIGMIAFLWIALFIFSVIYGDRYARSWDVVDFALSLDRFDLLAMQPHFPGYPYFILGGMLVKKVINDPVLALTTMNAAMYASAIWPIYGIARRYLHPLGAVLCALITITSPYVWMLSGSAISEPTAIAILWWYMWSLALSLENENSRWRSLVPTLLFSILLGVRLSFFPFGLALIAVWFYQYRSSKSPRHWKMFDLLIKVGAAIAFQLIWLVGLIYTEGSFSGFYRLGRAFIGGHFSEWGGAITTSSSGVMDRLLVLIKDNLIWTSFAGQSVYVGGLLLVWVMFFLIALRGIWKSSMGAKPVHTWMFAALLAIGGYFVWAFIGQNIDKPRHIMPIVGMLLLITSILVVKHICWRVWRFIMIGTGILLAIAQSYQGVSLLKLSAQEPAVYQLHRYLNEADERMMVYTWEENRVFDYLQASYPRKRIQTYRLFLAEIGSASDRKIYLTDHVLTGFERQAGDLRENVRVVARFDSPLITDPIYGQIVLYEWIDTPDHER